MARNKLVHHKQNQLRIIGGTWRGRKLNFPDLPGLRPTSDRVRETLFNWLQSDVVGARCLDLFAGSGALGLEALSRGAKHTVFVDSQVAAIEQIKQSIRVLGAENGSCIIANAQTYLENITKKNVFDLIFLDPPFHRGLLIESLRGIQKKLILTDTARVYIETETPLEESEISKDWDILKSKTSGNVRYYLLGQKTHPDL